VDEAALQGLAEHNTIDRPGLPLESWPAITKGQIRACHDLGLHVVEDIATATDTIRQKLGMGATELIAKAKAFMANKDQSATANKVAELGGDCGEAHRGAGRGTRRPQGEEQDQGSRVTDNDSLSDEQVRLLHGWFVREMIDLDRAPAPSDTRGGLLLGGLVYGEKYIERFQSLCMPSLKAPGNAKALHRRSRMVLFTDGAGYGALHDFQRQREIAGYPTQLFVLPQPLMDSLTALTGLLGGTQNLGVQIAARYGMAYHPLFPDHVYSPDYFPNLLKLGKRYPAIAQSSISANDTLALRAALAAHGRGAALAVPLPTLAPSASTICTRSRPAT
jgi:hypothetical protein